MSTTTSMLLFSTPTCVILIVCFLVHDCWTQTQHLCDTGLDTQVAWCVALPFVCPPHCESRRAQTIRRPAGVFVLQGTHSAPESTVYASAVHPICSHYMQRKLKTRCMTQAINADTTTTQVRALHCDWRSTWERACGIRKASLAKRNPDSDRVVATYERVGALLGICSLQWIQTLLHYCGSLEMPWGIMDEISFVYVAFCAESKAIYVGSRGASHYHTRR